MAGGQIQFARSRIGKAAVAEYTAGQLAKQFSNHRSGGLSKQPAARFRIALHSRLGVRCQPSGSAVPPSGTPVQYADKAVIRPIKEVQYFGSYRVTDYLAWAKAEDGKWIRRFETSDSCILENFGGQTAAEKSLNLISVESEEEFEQEGVFEKWIAAQDEETPAQLAGLWSINTLELENMDLPPSTGYLGYFEKRMNL